jgi:hypothetical protein
MNITEMYNELDDYKRHHPNATDQEIQEYLNLLQEQRIDELEKMYADTFLSKLKDFFRNFKYHIGYYNIKYGIKNLWIWRKVIWEDRWYDYSFFDKIVKFKLQTMVDNWDKSHYVCPEADKEDMKKIIKLFDDIEKYEDSWDDEDKVDETYEKIGRLIYGISERDFICKDGKYEHHVKNKTANLRRWWD